MKKFSCSIAVYICIVALTGCALAQQGAISKAHSAIEKDDYTYALKSLSDAEKYVEPTPELKAEIVYMRAACYEGLERKSEAIGALKYLVDKFPDTHYAYQAKEKLRELEDKKE